MNRKMSAEQAAEEGIVVGEKYTPAGRTGVFDVPAYDDIADLHELFKRFANTSVANGGDTMIGVYNVNGRFFVNGKEITPLDILPVVNRTASFVVAPGEAQTHTRFMAYSTTDITCTVPADTSTVTDGTHFSLVQTGTGKVSILGGKAIGTLKTGGIYTTLEIMWHDGFWWCLSGGGGGGGGEGVPAKPVLTLNADKTAITWPAVTGTAGPTLGYGYEVSPANIVCTLAGTTLTINSVTEDIDYTFKVWGVNVAGRGESSDLVAKWTGLAAPVISGAAAPAGVTANWTAVAGATSYLVAWKKKSDSAWQTKNAGNVVTYTVSGLTEQVAYDIKVASVKLNVTSAYSNIVELTPGPNVPPPAPSLSYTAEGQFTIGNYNAAFVYRATGATQSGNLISSVSNGATVTVERGDGSPKSNASTMNVLANGRILSPGDDQTSTGCGPRGDLCCPGGQIMDTSGRTCGGAPGSFISDPAQAAAFCNGQCDDNCWQLTIACYNWRWSDYSGDGYKLIGSIWGKATNG